MEAQVNEVEDSFFSFSGLTILSQVQFGAVALTFIYDGNDDYEIDDDDYYYFDDYDDYDDDDDEVAVVVNVIPECH